MRNKKEILEIMHVFQQNDPNPRCELDYKNAFTLLVAVVLSAQSTDKGNIYVRTDLNETPVHLIPGNDNLYLPWHTVRDYLLNFILVID